MRGLWSISGVDECLLKIAHDVGIRRFTFQDYWGFLNPVSNQCHDMILVVDEYAKELTNARTFAAVEVVGNPKYDHYRDLDTVTLRARFWEKYNLNKENAIIGFIGQPLNQFIGYANTLKKCSEIISEMGANLRCFYRPHPKEDANTQHQIVRFFERSGCELTLHDCDSPIEELFAGSDLLVTFFNSGLRCADVKRIFGYCSSINPLPQDR